MLTNLIVINILQYGLASIHDTVHLKLIQCVNYISIKLEKMFENYCYTLYYWKKYYIKAVNTTNF